MRATHLAVAVCALLLAGAGCADRTYLTATHGRAYHAALARQAANPNAGAQQPGADKGLDSQEAAVVADGYRDSLARKGQTAPQEPVLLLAPSAREGRSANYMPPVSVPQER